MPTMNCYDCGVEIDVHHKIKEFAENGKSIGAICDDCTPDYDWDD